MTRVLSALDRTIMVSVYDVVPGDILFVTGDERDLIVESVERRENGAIRYHYKDRPGGQTPPHTIWMGEITGGNGLVGGRVFLHDLKREGLEFDGEPDSTHILLIELIKEIHNVTTRS